MLLELADPLVDGLIALKHHSFSTLDGTEVGIYSSVGSDLLDDLCTFKVLPLRVYVRLLAYVISVYCRVSTESSVDLFNLSSVRIKISDGFEDHGVELKKHLNAETLSVIEDSDKIFL